VVNIKYKNLKLSTKQKVIIIILCEMITLACGVAAYYVKNPIWMVFIITTILISMAFRICVFISFVVKYIEFNAAPELSIENKNLSMENEKLLKKIANLEPKFNKIVEGEKK